MKSKLTGKCVVCQAELGAADYDRQNVVAAIGPEGTIVCCAAHLLGGPGNAEYEEAIRLFALAKARPRRCSTCGSAALPDFPFPHFPFSPFPKSCSPKPNPSDRYASLL